MLFKASVSLLIFFLDDLSVDINGVLKVPYYYCNPVGLIYLGTPVLGFPGGTSGKEARAGDIRDARSIPGLGRSPGAGRGNPLQYSCLENPTDRGAWQTIVHRVAKSRTRKPSPAKSNK